MGYQWGTPHALGPKQNLFKSKTVTNKSFIYGSVMNKTKGTLVHEREQHLKYSRATPQATPPG